MLMALIAMLVVVMAGIVMLRAASASAGRVRRGQAAEQAYLTVSSAAAYLRDSLLGDSYAHYKRVVTWYVEDPDEPGTYIQVPAPLVATLDVPQPYLENWVYKPDDVGKSNPLHEKLLGLYQSYWASEAATAELSFEAEGFAPVTAELSIQEVTGEGPYDAELRVELYLADVGGVPADPNCKLTLTLQGRRRDTPMESSQPLSEDGKYNFGGQDYYKVKDISEYHDILWEHPQITRYSAAQEDAA